MNLKEIRESEPKIGPMDEFISTSGQNLAVVFDNLNQKDLDFEDKINTCMKSVLPTTKRIRAVRSGRLRLTIEWYHNEANEPFYLNEMSDGTEFSIDQFSVRLSVTAVENQNNHLG